MLPSSSTKPAVYVVDDDFGVLSSLRFALETDGFDVTAFKSGLALLDVIDTTAADCFVIDYKMPNMSGIDLAMRLRRCGIETPIILMTGYPGDDILPKAIAAGIDHVLLKPHVEESLASLVRGVIRERLAR